MTHQGEAFRTYIFHNPKLKNMSRAAAKASQSEVKTKEWRSAMYRIEKAIKLIDFESDPKLKIWLTDKFPDFMKTLSGTTIIGDGNISDSSNAISQFSSGDRLRIMELEKENKNLRELNAKLTQQIIDLTKKILE